MMDWNVVATAHERRFTLATELLEPFGLVEGTSYYNVLVMRVDDVAKFLSGLVDTRSRNPGHFDFSISRIVPAHHTFNFQFADEFEQKARDSALAWTPDLKGKSFHVRMHRRGFKGRLTSPVEERFLDDAILDALERAGIPGLITFEDPDAIISVETIDNRAGLSLWGRDELQCYPFLRLD